MYKERINHFDKVKGSFNRIKGLPRGGKIFFDTETYLYSHKPGAEPIVIPYLIGVTDEATRTFKYFLGENPTIRFFQYLLGDKRYEGLTLPEMRIVKWTKAKDSKEWKRVIKPLTDNCLLVAFNIGYDFHSLRPWIEAYYKEDIFIYYLMSTDKKFINASFKVTKGDIFKKNVELRLKDLWMWDKRFGLKKRIEKCRRIIWGKNGQMNNTDFAKVLYKTVRKYGLDYDTFNKGSLGEDYVKWNLHKINNDYFYYRTEEDAHNKVNPVKLNIKQELDYLKIDVLSMPVIFEEEEQTKQLMLSVLKIKDPISNKYPIDKDISITSPGFAKYLLEEYAQQYLQQMYRVKVSVDEYEDMVDSYNGAFTASNPHITYIDSNVFKTMFPGEDMYENTPYIIKGEQLSPVTPRIRSYDINSEYPSVMYSGVPFGYVTAIKPSGKEGIDYCTWYEINFYDYVDPETSKVYKWKSKYNCFNNAFFGDSYVKAAGNLSVKKYILKELYELFLETNESCTQITNTYYQKLDRTYLPHFIDYLYTIKQNKEGLYTDEQSDGCKLMMNSEYGKFAEKFRKYKIIWSNQLDKVIEVVKSEWMDYGKQPDTFIQKVFKKGEFDPKAKIGFVKLENTTKRFDSEGFDCRESIMTGLYITQRSRWLLISAIKGEIDQGNIFLNCDTDSIKIIQFKPPKFNIHKDNLGAWKFEGAFDVFGHPGKLKKYYTINTDDNVPFNIGVKVATGGIPKEYIVDSNISRKAQVDKLRIIYNPNNRVLIKSGKKTCSWTEVLHQPIIKDVDIEVIGSLDKDKSFTHLIKEGVLGEWSE